ncbi:MAG: PrsW family intramembrane metalloprotease [Chloroflexi bacterium]|nr:PrsW family intramembrane metalloprotease [Chloroflexota bacterium]
MNILLISALAAALPALLYSLAIWLLDKYEREPWGLILITFVWGAVPAVVVSLILEITFELPLALLVNEQTSAAITAVLGAPIIEELAKGFALLLVFLVYRKQFDGILDGIVYASLIGFGFAMSEDFLYFLSAYLQEGIQLLQFTFFLRTILFGLNHAFYTSFTGLGFGYASLASNRRGLLVWLAPPLGLAGAVMAHMFHNFALVVFDWPGLWMSLVVSWGGVLVFLSIVLLTWQREGVWLRTQLLEEIQSGLLSSDEFKVLPSWRRRIAVQLRELSQRGVARALRVRRRQELLTRLAFLKNRRAATGLDTRVEAESLRAQIRQMAV